MKATTVQAAHRLLRTRATAKQIIADMAGGEDVVVSTTHCRASCFGGSQTAVRELLERALRASIDADEEALAGLGVTGFDAGDAIHTIDDGDYHQPPQDSK